MARKTPLSTLCARTESPPAQPKSKKAVALTIRSSSPRWPASFDCEIMISPPSGSPSGRTSTTRPFSTKESPTRKVWLPRPSKSRQRSLPPQPSVQMWSMKNSTPPTRIVSIAVGLAMKRISPVLPLELMMTVTPPISRTSFVLLGISTRPFTPTLTPTSTPPAALAKRRPTSCAQPTSIVAVAVEKPSDCP